MSYRKWLDSIPLPGWLRRHWGARFAYIPAILADAVLEAVRQGVRARFPSVAPEDALIYLAEDRLLEPGLEEDPETLRRRILDVWKAWEWGGTERGLLSQLRAWLPSANWRVIANREWSVPPEGREASPNWDPGHGRPGDPDYRPPRGKCAIRGEEWWSRMWVLLQHPHPWAPWYYGDEGARFGEGKTYGSTALRAHVEAVGRIVRLWKAGHEYVPAVIVNLDTVIYGTDVPYGSFNYGGTAAYWSVSEA